MGFTHWLGECDTPLSIHSHNLPDSATLREQNDSNPDPTYLDCWPSERYPSDGPDDGDQCSECRCAPGQPHALGCDEAAKVTDAVINVAPEHVESCVSEGSREHRKSCGTCADTACAGILPEGEMRNAAPPCAYYVESCPECGAVTDIDYGPESVLLPKRESGAAEETSLQSLVKTADRIADTFSVPFKTQEWMFESLCKAKLANLQSMIDDHFDLIIEMARDRFRRGYAKYGSAMYSWSPERRLDETLQELADAVVYPTSGPMP